MALNGCPALSCVDAAAERASTNERQDGEGHRDESSDGTAANLGA